MPRAALHTSGELRAYHGVPRRGPVSDAMARELVRGYYACVSYTDAQIGRVLAELERAGIADRTIVVLWGDHGWNLGEHALWCKHSCFETSMHAPLIVRAPGIEPGRRTGALAEFIDIYPSLCELAGLPAPAHLEGQSFVPWMRDPLRPGRRSAVGRCGAGDTIRTDRYRYTLYTRPNGEVTGRMLYDHRTDPGEDANIAGREDAAATVRELESRLTRVRSRVRSE